MTQPDGLPTTVGQADSNPLTDSVIRAAVNDAIRQTSYNNPDLPSHKDGPSIGDAPPVDQPDSRIVPAWALGIAVASIGVGAGITGIGCGAWLVLQGLASVTLNGVLMVTLPFAGLAMAATAIGGAINKARRVNAVTHNHYSGPVDQRTVRSKSVGVWVKTTNQP